MALAGATAVAAMVVARMVWAVAVVVAARGAAAKGAWVTAVLSAVVAPSEAGKAALAAKEVVLAVVKGTRRAPTLPLRQHHQLPMQGPRRVMCRQRGRGESTRSARRRS